MAARSFSVSITNFLGGGPWKRTGINLDHGVWSENNARIPPETIPAVSLDDDGNAVPGLAFFEAESQGVATGCEGSVDYHNDRFGDMHIFFDNPFIGGNQFSVAPNAGVNFFWGDPGGNDAHIDLRIVRPV
jgi:Aegerolysin